MDFDQREVAISRAILENARHKILVADVSKFDVCAHVKICNAKDLDYVILNSPAPPSFEAYYKRISPNLLLQTRKMSVQTNNVDIFIIGGGINGCGIARDAAGRGYKVALAEMNDLASATSSASTKLFHGGLRYLEFFEFRLVREALIEREILLRAMPHISWPMRFVLPLHNQMRFVSDTPTSKTLSFFMPWMKGRRPAWLIRFGLFLYDNLGGREILPGTKTLKLRSCDEGAPLVSKFEKAFEFSDCWVEDSDLLF